MKCKEKKSDVATDNLFLNPPQKFIIQILKYAVYANRIFNINKYIKDFNVIANII